MEERYRCCANCRHYIHPLHDIGALDGPASAYYDHSDRKKEQGYIFTFCEDSIRRAGLHRNPGDWCADLFEPNERKRKAVSKPIELEIKPLNNHWLKQQASWDLR